MFNSGCVMGVEPGWEAIHWHHLLIVSHLINKYSGGSCSTQPLLCSWPINWWSVNWWPDNFFSHDPTRDWRIVSIQSHQRINLGNVLWLTVRLCKISGDGSGWYFRTFKTLFHSTKVEKKLCYWGRQSWRVINSELPTSGLPTSRHFRGRQSWG